ncbi:transcriptional repressor [Marinibacterium sp. SX1]|uniref:transcriptional repressor n=1 Tax=Marinibacterium sp. SX1 TaxID=3388424 RepID=UPI003D1811DA
MTYRGETIQAEVLAVLDRQTCPMSAYAILDEMRKSSPGMAPPTIYRALAALRKRGYVQRVESMNAFIAYRGGRRRHGAVLSICDDCGLVEQNDAPELIRDIGAITGQSGFAAARYVVEVHGLCASCGAGGVSA